MVQISYNWLNSYIDIPCEPKELKYFLTMAGLEVEEMFYQGEGLDKIITGEIIGIKDHENADNLKVCQVDCGENKRQIVCGASNIAENLKVAVALPGSRLPGGLKIEETELRGVKSSGMICSADELGLKEERQSGIMELPEEVEAGDLLVEALLLNDYTYKLDLTPNYARCLGHLGVAREVRGLSDETLEINWPELLPEDDGKTFQAATPEVEIQDPDLCQRYTCRLIEDVEIKASPLWMQRRLEAAGIRPINNIVDITNYVMLEYNQPLHAFDYDNINGRKIIVRRANPGERLITLDDEKRQLTPEVLVIADREKPVGLAGVMGGANTEVTESTGRVLLEAASFDAVNVRRTAKKYGLSSESSHRFERKIDITAVAEASRRACYLLERYAGGKITEEMVDCYPEPCEKKKLQLETDRVNNFLGVEIAGEEMSDMLTGLGFEADMKDDSRIAVSIPGFRRDVDGEADLIEEIARVYGYNNIPYTRPASAEPGGRNPEQKASLKINRILRGQGLEEVKNFSLRPKDDNLTDYLQDYYKFYLAVTEGKSRSSREDSFESNFKNSIVKLKNPLSQAFSRMRISLLPGLIEVLSLNSRKQVKDMSIYETGRVFVSRGERNRPVETDKIGLASMGAAYDPWNLSAPDYFYLKGAVENLLDKLEIDSWSWQRIKLDIFHPGRVADLKFKNKRVGVLGELHPDVIEEFKLPARTSAVELDKKLIYQAAGYEKISYQQIPRFPSISRDLALLISEDIPARDVIEAVEEAASDILISTEIFDFYQGEQIPEGRKSLALNMVFQDYNKTLKEEEVEKQVDNIIEVLEDEFQAKIRGK